MSVEIGETIPDFHNIEFRVRQLEESAKKDTLGRLSDPEDRNILESLRKYTGEMCKGERLYREGVLPKRICHCDTKVNNMLFVAEDDPDIEKVGFNMEIFRAFTEGYLESASSFLTSVKKENLPYAACLFPYMQAVRFFSDYLDGYKYYKIEYPENNLVRTRNQVALFLSAMRKVPQMREFISGSGTEVNTLHISKKMT